METESRLILPEMNIGQDQQKMQKSSKDPPLEDL